ncbi:MAG: SUMF1/EgtB/PvdO family nonheme iron enzyme [Myxococcus sp.]|nr:SUMF1/EgtB/PvdO family nonheme iron enzyme [Myxococcus sp.]
MRGSLCLALAFFAACGPDDSTRDAGAPLDPGLLADAGLRADAGVDDAGAPDAGGGLDAGPKDGGDGLDAGADDAGTGLDAGAPDAGGGADAGARDAGGSADAGPLVTCTAAGLPGTCIDVSDCRDTRRPTPGLCPGSAAIQCCTPRYANTCDPNARPAPNAGLVEAPGAGGCPPGMVSVGTFCIDRYEAFLEELDGGAWCPFVNPGGRRLRARSASGAVPQGFITQVQATAACLETSKRLCTDAEWLRACRGPANTTYPYGNTRLTGVCNDRRAVHPAVELYGTSASWIFSHIDSPCLNQLDGGLARAGDFSGCASAEGVFDLMGNLHEWTADPAGTFRGGFYVDTVINGNGCLYATTAHDVSHWDYSTGFRCCR